MCFSFTPTREICRKACHSKDNQIRTLKKKSIIDCEFIRLYDVDVQQF